MAAEVPGAVGVAAAPHDGRVLPGDGRVALPFEQAGRGADGRHPGHCARLCTLQTWTDDLAQLDFFNLKSNLKWNCHLATCLLNERNEEKYSCRRVARKKCGYALQYASSSK